MSILHICLFCKNGKRKLNLMILGPSWIHFMVCGYPFHFLQHNESETERGGVRAEASHEPHVPEQQLLRSAECKPLQLVWVGPLGFHSFLAGSRCFWPDKDTNKHTHTETHTHTQTAMSHKVTQCVVQEDGGGEGETQSKPLVWMV